MDISVSLEYLVNLFSVSSTDNEGKKNIADSYQACMCLFTFFQPKVLP